MYCVLSNALLYHLDWSIQFQERERERVGIQYTDHHEWND